MLLKNKKSNNRKLSGLTFGKTLSFTKQLVPLDEIVYPGEADPCSGSLEY